MPGYHSSIRRRDNTKYQLRELARGLDGVVGVDHVGDDVGVGGFRRRPWATG